MVDVISTISAASRIYDHIQKRRYQVKDNVLNPDEFVVQINESIKAKYKLDIFSLLSLAQLQAYESVLNTFISEFTFNNVTSRDLNTEINIIKNSVRIENEFISSKNIYISESAKSFVKEFRVHENELINAIKYPLFVSCFESFDPIGKSQFFVTAKHSINSVDVILGAHLCDEKVKNDSLGIVTPFILNETNYSSFLDNPVRLFLLFIDKYGLDLVINEKTKRIFDKETVYLKRPFIMKDLLKYVRIRDSKIDLHLSLSLKLTSYTTMVLELVYGVNQTKYIQELRKGF